LERNSNFATLAAIRRASSTTRQIVCARGTHEAAHPKHCNFGALGLLSGCGDNDVREHTFAEVACSGFLGTDNGEYKCTSDNGSVKEVDVGKLPTRTVKVNRRTGTVAFDGEVVGECRVADFDSWECVEKTIQYRSSLRNGGYLEEWCSVSPDAPPVPTPDNCKGGSDTTEFR
jgi:hypothetical protein